MVSNGYRQQHRRQHGLHTHRRALSGGCVGPEWNFFGNPSVDPWQDIAFTYTLDGQPGTYRGIVGLWMCPEPSTCTMLLTGCSPTPGDGEGRPRSPCHLVVESRAGQRIYRGLGRPILVGVLALGIGRLQLVEPVELGGGPGCPLLDEKDQGGVLQRCLAAWHRDQS